MSTTRTPRGHDPIDVGQILRSLWLWLWRRQINRFGVRIAPADFAYRQKANISRRWAARLRLTPFSASRPNNRNIKLVEILKPILDLSLPRRRVIVSRPVVAHHPRYQLAYVRRPPQLAFERRKHGRLGRLPRRASRRESACVLLH